MPGSSLTGTRFDALWLSFSITNLKSAVLNGRLGGKETGWPWACPGVLWGQALGQLLGAGPCLGPALSQNPALLWHLSLWTYSLTVSFLPLPLTSLPHPRLSPSPPHTPLCLPVWLLYPLPHSPSAPSSSSSAKGGGAPWPGGAQTYSPSSTCRYRSLAQPATTAARLSSVSSHDSGFVSQDATYSKPPSPMPSDITSQVRGCLQSLELLRLAWRSPGPPHWGPTWLRRGGEGLRAVSICHSHVSRGLRGPTTCPFPDSLPTAFFYPRGVKEAASQLRSLVTLPLRRLTVMG